MKVGMDGYEVCVDEAARIQEVLWPLGYEIITYSEEDTDGCKLIRLAKHYQKLTLSDIRGLGHR